MLVQLAVRYIAPKAKRTKRILFDAESDVAELQEAIQTHFGIPVREQVLRCNVKNQELRVIAGFNLDFYEIGNNAFLHVSRLEVDQGAFETTEEAGMIEEDALGENFVRRVETFNRLRFAERATALDAMHAIEEIDEPEDDDERQIAQLRRAFMEIAKTKRARDFQAFLDGLLTLDTLSQLSVLESTDKVGWTGIHYAVLYDEEYVIGELLKIFKGEILGFVSEDGWSPLSLAAHNKNWRLFSLMAGFADAQQLELQTAKGSLPHQVFRYADMDVIERLVLDKGVDPNKEDFGGRKVIDMLSPDKKEQVLLLMQLRSLPKKPFSLFGEVEKNSFFFGWSKRCLFLNAESRALERYGSISDHPFRPKEVIPLHGIDRIAFSGYFKEKEKGGGSASDVYYDEKSRTIHSGRGPLNPKDNYMEFFYGSARHKYRIPAPEQAAIWESDLTVAAEWARYYEAFIMKIRNPEVKEKALKIWKAVNKNFEQYSLYRREDVKKLLASEKVADDSDKGKTGFVAPKAGLRDFDVLKLLGRGAFGKVYKVLHRKSRKIFAMKVLRKKHLIKEQQIKYSLIEKRILEQNNNNPFLLSLYFAFQTVENLYMVIDFCPNEDLSVLLNKQPDSCLEEKVIRFYIAEIVLAIEDLHRRNYIYRDLKPENILIDEGGHAKLADFGLAAENIRTASDFARSFCGSPIYISPEILKSKRSYKTSDYYTIGVVIYELLTGDPPFFNEDIDRLYGLIKKGSFAFPKNKAISESAKDLITRLITTNPKTRLGHERGIAELKEHAFFAEINWERLLRREIAPPLVFAPVVHNFGHRILLKDTEYDESNFGVNYLPQFDYVREEFRQYVDN